MKIDLSRKYNGPSLVGAQAANSIQYPEIYFDLSPDQLEAIPDEGEATISFRVRRVVMEKEKAGNSKEGSITLCIKSIDFKNGNDTVDRERNREALVKTLGRSMSAIRPSGY